MSRTSVLVADPGYNGTAAVTARAMNPSTDHYIDLDGVKCERLGVRFHAGTANGDSNANHVVVTVKAGDKYGDSEVGNLTFAVAKSTTRVLALESARFKDADGEIKIDLSTTLSGATLGATAIIEAYVID